MSCDLYCGFYIKIFRVARTAYMLLPEQCAALRWWEWQVCAKETYDVYVSYSATSEAIGHASMTSATANSIKGNKRSVVDRTIVSELDDM